MIEHRQLRHVLALADHGNFRRAAEAAHITQPGLTKSIHCLENWLGVKLFDRYPKSVVPTAFGKIVIERARTVISEFEDIKREIDLVGGLDIGELSVGAEAIFAESILTPSICRMLKSHSGLQLKIKIGKHQELKNALMAKQVDFYIADIMETKSEEQFQIIPLKPQRMIHFCRPNHPLLGQPEITLQHFLSYPAATPYITPLVHKDYIDAKSQHDTSLENRPEKITIECENYSILKNVVQCSNCVASAPKTIIAHELQNKTLAEVNVKDSLRYAQAGIVYLRNHTLPPAAEALFGELAFVSRVHE